MDPRISNVIRLLPLLLISYLLAACPLSTEYPLTTRTDIQINQKLLGSWDVSMEGIDNSVVNIFPFNNTEYYREWITEKEGMVRLRAYVTNIDNVSLLNIHNIEGQKKSFLLCKPVFTSDNTVSFLIIDDLLFKETPSSSNELYNVVRKNLTNPKLYYGANVNLKRIGKSNNDG